MALSLESHGRNRLASALAVVLLAVLAFSACVEVPPPAPNAPEEPSSADAGPDSPQETVAEGTRCERACGRFRELKCDAGNRTPGGARCEDVCESHETESKGRWVVECIVAAESCEAADGCVQ